MENVLQCISGLNDILKQAMLAKTIDEELEYWNLSDVLGKHLPVTDPDKRSEAAEKLFAGVQDFYNQLGSKADDVWMERQLNKGLGNLDPQEQGRWLTNFLHCAKNASSDLAIDETYLNELSNRSTYSEADVNALIGKIKEMIHQQAGFMASQEFAVMADHLASFSEETIQQMMNSGQETALSYAAAMYITCETNEVADAMTAYQLGLMAAEAVESNKLLAQYHLGKLRLEELMEQLLDLGKKLLATAVPYLMEVSAFALRVGGVALMADLFINLAATFFSPVAPIVVVVAIVGAAYLVMKNFTQEDAKEVIGSVWDGVKQFAKKIYRIFFDDNTPPPPGGSSPCIVGEKDMDRPEMICVDC